MKVAALGDNCVDIYPRLGRYYCTGNVVDFAVHMQRLGIPTSVISTTGDDVFGRQLVRAVDEVNLRALSGLLRVKRLIEVLRIEVAHLVVIIVDIHLLLSEELPGTDCVDRTVRERIHTILIEEEKDVSWLTMPEQGRYAWIWRCREKWEGIYHP